MNRKASSPTQPGRGIRKIVDLFHELSDLVDKAGKYCASNTAPEMGSMDSQDFDGLSEEAIEEEQKEYVHVMINACDLGMTDNARHHCNSSRRRCHIAMTLLDKLIPNFKERAMAAENINSFCSPVCISTLFIHASQADMNQVASRCQ
jgi:hypothetical protein